MKITTIVYRLPLLGAMGLQLAACSFPLPAGRTEASERAASRPITGLAGLDPYDTGCASDAVTSARAPALDASGNVLATVELRWSERCETAWARAVRAPGARGALVATVHAVGLSSSFEHATDGEVWTDMVPAPRVCATATGGIRRRGGLVQDARATSCTDMRRTGLASE